MVVVAAAAAECHTAVSLAAGWAQADPIAAEWGHAATIAAE